MPARKRPMLITSSADGGEKVAATLGAAVAVADAVTVADGGAAQLDAPALDDVPLGQGRQAVLPDALKEPASHAVQLLAEIAAHEVLKVPAGQRVQAVPPTL